MKVALLRVGIDTGCGGMHGPLFKDGSLDYVPIPDEPFRGAPTYGTAVGSKGRPLVEYFPESRRRNMQSRTIHWDPEFKTFTYGDPTPPKAGLRRLKPGDLLVFFCGLQGWDFHCDPALYLLGYFEVAVAGRASEFEWPEVRRLFSENAHVIRAGSRRTFLKEDPVLVKGLSTSRMFKKAVRISAVGRDRTGRPINVLSPEMQKVFGTFNGRICIQRSPTRWVVDEYVLRSAQFVRSLE